ncbi:hypothetical protein GUITHDRAFT_147345 [Guillardia theta CCMP2712]|uniref:Uncharacterized protein n=1 Tax=Guillardia theta (strain CCMP2712) TaxID=905079 RepID=L1IEG7_GUITC|nr:hypothetical protein GUITHDRAFT_147345 [Guillardia theta CCMP2712]EKX34269.1 hypothetical protein GUITHDRAFT_147345 [Guillardia theta CCMP2712]|eukprot:XP_005821249.1 hypothetical protein GUITHDRAFT_147345 [Guillardia theta CCMP2712]
MSSNFVNFLLLFPSILLQASAFLGPLPLSPSRHRLGGGGQDAFAATQTKTSGSAAIRSKEEEEKDRGEIIFFLFGALLAAGGYFSTQQLQFGQATDVETKTSNDATAVGTVDVPASTKAGSWEAERSPAAAVEDRKPLFGIDFSSIGKSILRKDEEASAELKREEEEAKKKLEAREREAKEREAKEREAKEREEAKKREAQEREEEEAKKKELEKAEKEREERESQEREKEAKQREKEAKERAREEKEKEAKEKQAKERAAKEEEAKKKAEQEKKKLSMRDLEAGREALVKARLQVKESREDAAKLSQTAIDLLQKSAQLGNEEGHKELKEAEKFRSRCLQEIEDREICIREARDLLDKGKEAFGSQRLKEAQTFVEASRDVFVNAYRLGAKNEASKAEELLKKIRKEAEKNSAGDLSGIDGPSGAAEAIQTAFRSFRFDSQRMFAGIQVVSSSGQAVEGSEEGTRIRMLYNHLPFEYKAALLQMMVGVSPNVEDLKEGIAAEEGWMFSVRGVFAGFPARFDILRDQVGDGSVWHLDEEVYSSSEQGDISSLVPSTGLLASLIRFFDIGRFSRRNMLGYSWAGVKSGDVIRVRVDRASRRMQVFVNGEKQRGEVTSLPSSDLFFCLELISSHQEVAIMD